MGLGDCVACMKWTFVVINAFICLCGCSILALGIWAVVHPASFMEQADDNSWLAYFRVAGIVLIVLGSFVAIVGFLGCCGAAMESQCMLVMCFILLLILFLCIAAGLILAAFGYSKAIHERHDTKEAFHKKMLDAISNQSSAANKNYTDEIQEKYKCCGADGPSDYINHNIEIPPSCGQNIRSCTTEVYHEPGSIGFALIPSLVSLLVTFIGMVVSMLLCCAIRDNY